MMKQSKQCPKCRSLRVGHIAVQPDLSGEFHRVVQRPAGHSQTVGWFGWAGPGVGVGVLEAYVCTECGYYESYVVSPAQVPWDKLEGFRMLNPDPDTGGPYR